MLKFNKSVLLFSLLVFTIQAPAQELLMPAPPQIAATAFLLMDAHSGTVLIESNSQQALPPASLTKMMTGYIAVHELDKGTLSFDDQVRVSIKAWQAEGSRMFIREGTTVSLEDLLRGIIIQSGNDSSIAVAEHIAGSEDAFADLMNQHAQLLGMKNSHFENSTGLPAEGHLTTAYDLALLARAIIMDHPQYYSMYAERYFTYNDIRQPNRNRLLWRDSSVDGLKTGHTEEAGYCLVVSAEREGMRLIAVVMGTQGEEARAVESQKLLTYGFRFYETRKLYDAGQVLEQVRIWGGQEDRANFGVSEDLYLTIPRGQFGALQTSVVAQPYLKAPIEAGTSYGNIELRVQDQIVAQLPLQALESVEQGGFFQRLWDSILLFFAKLIS